jgi:hypothetical protein
VFPLCVGNVEKDLFDETQEYHSDIPGLASRAKNHLEFLGLYYAQHRASKRHDIPAIRVRRSFFIFRDVSTGSSKEFDHLSDLYLSRSRCIILMIE